MSGQGLHHATIIKRNTTPDLTGEELQNALLVGEQVSAQTAGRERAGCRSQDGELNFFDGFLYFISVFGLFYLYLQK